MISSTLSIGVFDSGMGGLTVLRALHETLPAESFIYLGDTARLPYGTKSKATVLQYATQMAKILVEHEIKALVIACNTATTAALPHLQQMLSDIPVIGVVAPGAEAAIHATKTKQIAVLATETTIQSKAYQSLIQAHCPEATIQTRACSLLVALAEEGLTTHTITAATLAYYLEGIQNIDTILLGCTHFPVFKPLLQTLIEPHIQIVDSAQATAITVKRRLQQLNLLNSDELCHGQIKYLVTDAAERFKTVGSLFFGQSLKTASVSWVDL